MTNPEPTFYVFGTAICTSFYILGNACNYIIKKGDSTIAVTSQLCMIMMAIHMVMDK